MSSMGNSSSKGGAQFADVPARCALGQLLWGGQLATVDHAPDCGAGYTHQASNCIDLDECAGRQRVELTK